MLGWLAGREGGRVEGREERKKRKSRALSWSFESLTAFYLSCVGL